MVKSTAIWYTGISRSGFFAALNSEIYVDKTGMIDITNKVVNTMQAFICNSRPRRFGKSVAANMLTAYYSKGCDSKEMFAGLNIDDIVSAIQRAVLKELREVYPAITGDEVIGLPDAMSLVTEETGNKFVVIIDEWDVLIRDAAMNQKVQDEYIGLLCRMFKGVEPTRFIALAYLTGILPIKRVLSESSLNNFDEYTMLDAGELAPYIGFTENEVCALCEKYGRDFRSVQRWYDGYLFQDTHTYNPKAVVSIMLRDNFQSCWSKAGTFELIRPYINMDFDGLKTAIIEMISGDAVAVDTTSFQNDMVSFTCKDDVLTLLIHLGYLAYDERKHTAYLPNEEIRQVFISAAKKKKWNELAEFERQASDLLDATLDLEADKVAAGILFQTNQRAACREGLCRLCICAKTGVYCGISGSCSRTEMLF